MVRVVFAFVVTLSLFLAVPAPVSAADPETPATPFLRIETGLHTALINRLAVDGEGRLVATVSDDKTARLWTLADGKLLATLRVPLGPGNEGRLYAVALSPDGKRLLVAGHTGSSWDAEKTFDIYVFDVEKRSLKFRLPNMPSTVNHLAFSPDGKFFAAVFGGKGGLGVWDAQTGKLVGKDKEYGDLGTSVVFDRSGRLATASFDGHVRLYDSGVKLVQKLKAPGGKQPYSVAFTPDGALLAVGYFDKTRVDVLSGKDLKPLYAPDTADLQTGRLNVVAWAGEGDAVQLVAAGSARDRDGAYILRRWAAAGKGRSGDLAVARDSISHLVPVPGGGVAFASADPSWGLVDGRGRLAYQRRGEIGDFRALFEGRFGLSADGLAVEFGMAKDGRQPFRFDFRSRALTRDPAASDAFLKPIVKAPMLEVADWKDSPAPRFGKRTLKLDPEERSRSLAIRPDGSGFLLGGDGALRLYDAEGEERKRVALPGAAWGVAVARDAALAVAALGDGTLRWYSLAPGEELTELAALFPHADGKRWVAWTPEAFFDHADVGGKELVGFHLNQGRKTTPLWIDFSQVYRLFYAPDLVAGKLKGGGAGDIRARLAEIGDIRARFDQRPLPGIELAEYCVGGAEAAACEPFEGIRAATRGFARVSDVTEPAAAAGLGTALPTYAGALPAGTGSVVLKFTVTDRGGGIGAVDVFLNDRNIGREGGTRGFARVAEPAAPAAVGDAAKDKVRIIERTVRLDPGDNQIRVHAYEASGAVFERSPVIALKAPPAARAVEPVPDKPRLFVLAVGVNQYQPGINRLNFAVADARSFVENIRRFSAPLYREIVITELYDQEASEAAVEQALGALAGQAESRDTALIYLAGHGVVVDQQYYFVTQNVGAPTAVAEQALGEPQLISLLSKIPARNSFLFLDTCHAGAMTNDSAAKIGHEIGRYVLAASASLEEALDSYNGRNGIFAHALSQGLAGNADSTKDGIINNFALGFFVQETVESLARQKNWRQQAVFKIASDGAKPFPLARLEKK